MTYVAYQSEPLRYSIYAEWEAVVLLLVNDKYGLVMNYNHYKPSKRLKKVIRDEFDTPDNAIKYAREWVAKNHDALTDDTLSMG